MFQYQFYAQIVHTDTHRDMTKHSEEISVKMDSFIQC